MTKYDREGQGRIYNQWDIKGFIPQFAKIGLNNTDAECVANLINVNTGGCKRATVQFYGMPYLHNDILSLKLQAVIA